MLSSIGYLLALLHVANGQDPTVAPSRYTKYINKTNFESCILLSWILFYCSQGCSQIPSNDTVDSVASLVMSRTTERGVKVEVHRTFAFFICRAPGFVFNFKPDYPLVNQFVLWCEDRRPGVWIPELETMPRCQPESEIF